MSDKKNTPPEPPKPRPGQDSNQGVAINRQKDGKRDNLGFTLTTKPPPKPKGK